MKALVSFALVHAACAGGGASTQPGPPRTADAGPSENERRLTKIATTIAPGSKRSGSIREGSFDTGGTVRVSAHLRAGRCYTMIAVGESGLLSATMELDDLGQTEAGEPLAYCTTRTGDHEVVIRARERGEGSFALGIFTHGPPGTAPPAEPVKAAPRPPASSVFAARLANAAAALGQAARPRGTIQEGLLSGGAVQDFFVPMRAPGCFGLVAVGEQPARQVDLVVFDEADRAVATARPHSGSAVVRHCTAEEKTFRVRVHVDGGTGAIAVRVFDLDQR